MNRPGNRDSGKGDLRGFKYPLEPLAKRAQWELDALNGKLVKVQHQLASLRAELGGVESLHKQASDNLGRQLLARLDSSRHQAGLLYLAQLQASMKRLQAQADALDMERAQLLQLCRAAETRLEGLRSHEADAIDTYAREQSYLHATEADRDWMMREAFNEASANAPVEPGSGA